MRSSATSGGFELIIRSTKWATYVLRIQQKKLRKPDNQERIHFREVVHVDIEKIMEVLIGLLAEQEEVTIEYTIEKPA